MPALGPVLFTAIHLKEEDVRGRRVLDVGACNFNGSIRPYIESLKPAEYIGVDIISGPGVDRVCNADDLTSCFGRASFDMVLCIEMLEHSPHWKKSILAMKEVLRPGGILVLTTRSRGYPVHGFPHDYWRFELEDMQALFAHEEILALEEDPLDPGVCIKIKILEHAPHVSFPESLAEQTAYCILTGQREKDFQDAFLQGSYYRKLALKHWIRQTALSIFHGCGRWLSRILGVSQKQNP